MKKWIAHCISLVALVIVIVVVAVSTLLLREARLTIEAQTEDLNQCRAERRVECEHLWDRYADCLTLRGPLCKLPDEEWWANEFPHTARTRDPNKLLPWRSPSTYDARQIPSSACDVDEASEECHRMKVQKLPVVSRHLGKTGWTRVEEAPE